MKGLGAQFRLALLERLVQLYEATMLCPVNWGNVHACQKLQALASIARMFVDKKETGL